MVAKSKAKHSKKDESKLREAAQLIFDEGIANLPGCEERAFASIAKATMEAALALDETAPAEEAQSASDEVADRRNERDKRVRAAQAALRAAKAGGPDSSD